MLKISSLRDLMVNNRTAVANQLFNRLSVTSSSSCSHCWSMRALHSTLCLSYDLIWPPPPRLPFRYSLRNSGLVGLSYLSHTTWRKLLTCAFRVPYVVTVFKNITNHLWDKKRYETTMLLLLECVLICIIKIIICNIY